MALLCSNCGAQLADNDDACSDCGQLSAAASAAFTNTPGAQQPTKACPYCAETILAAAIKCKHCGERLDAPITPPPPAPAPPPPVNARTTPAPAPFARPEAHTPTASAAITASATTQTPREIHNSDDAEELSRQLREIVDDRDIPGERSGRGLRVLTHLALFALAALVGAVAFALYHVNVVRQAGYYSWYDTYGLDNYLNLKRQRDALAVISSAVTLLLGELIIWKWRSDDGVEEE
jgi:hypothetical protein